jgi:hypothetical protein
MGNTTYSNHSEKDAVSNMRKQLKEEGHTIYYSSEKKMYFIITENPLQNRYLYTRITVNIYEEIGYECYLE